MLCGSFQYKQDTVHRRADHVLRVRSSMAHRGGGVDHEIGSLHSAVEAVFIHKIRVHELHVIELATEVVSQRFHLFRVFLIAHSSSHAVFALTLAIEQAVEDL